MYRTGDLARYLPNGEIEFLGRIDNQVKVHGFRIELGEIEAALSQHPTVAESVIVVREDQAGDKRLVAYVVMDDKVTRWQGDKVTVDRPVTLSDLRDYLQQKLPAYMIPAAFVFLDALPLTPNGKVDRRALPAPVITRLAATDPASQTATEAALAVLWREILGIKQVGREDNFFELGGHSLRATQLIYRIQETFAVTLSIRQLFESPTVAAIAQKIDRACGSRAATASAMALAVTPARSHCLVALQTEGSKPPFFCVHPLAGIVFPYYDLVSALSKDQPFYGLQAVGLTAEETPLTQIEAMAERYIDALSTLQPEGPYYLGGWSFGAYVAYEMARQLRQAGRSVALLAIIDTPPPSTNKLIDALNWSNFLLTAALPSIWPYVHDYFQLRNTEATPKSNGQRPQQVDKWSSVLKPATRFGSYQPADVLRLLRITRANIQAAINYVSQPYPGRLTLLRTGQTFGQTGQSPDLGWRALATGGVEIYRIPGGHMDVLRAPHVRVLAGQLQRRMEAAEVGSRK